MLWRNRIGGGGFLLPLEYLGRRGLSYSVSRVTPRADMAIQRHVGQAEVYFWVKCCHRRGNKLSGPQKNT